MSKQSQTAGLILEKMEAFLFKLPHVFATVQWGGKAYKLPNTKGDKTKPKLFIFSTLGSDDSGPFLHAEFKLPRQHADHAVKKYDWLAFSTFGNWAKSGWCSAKIRQPAQLKPLLTLFQIAYDNLPKPDPETSKRQSKTSNKQQQTTSSPVARKIDRIMDQVILPPDDEAFDRL